MKVRERESGGGGGSLVYIWLLVCLFCLSVQTPACTSQIPNTSLTRLLCRELYSHSIMKANTSSGSSAAFVLEVLSHEFNPAISIDFHSFNLGLPLSAC